MNPLSLVLKRISDAWLGFWIAVPAPNTVLALLRLGTGAMLLYVLFLRSFDLDGLFAPVAAGNPELQAALDSLAWPFSVLKWIDHPAWLWSVHVLAMAIGVTLMAGILTPLTAALSLVLQLSYAHAYPAMMVGLDNLLILALAALTIAPSGAVLGVFGRVEDDQPALPPHLAHLQDEKLPEPGKSPSWKWVGLRLLQLHLCLIYFHSALGKLSTDWLAGSALWHPLISATGTPLPVDAWVSRPVLTATVTYGLLLFELWYPVLIWWRPLRYPLLALALVVHLAVGIAWDMVPFNVMMLVLNLAFLPAHHMESALRQARPFLAMPWLNGTPAR